MQARPPRPTESRSLPAIEPDLAERLPLRVLVAEDFPVNQTLVLRLLSKLGYPADLAADGLAAREGD